MKHPKINHNGEMVHTTNSEGTAIHHTDEGIKAFHDWFGKSKSTDKHGRPQVVYHGTHADFDEFKPNNALGGLIFTSPNKDHAGEFSKANGANVKPVYIKTHKIYPKVVHAANEHKTAIAAKAKGYDAIKVQDHPGDVINTAVFHPNQLKSVFNNGKWANDTAKISENFLDYLQKARALRNDH